MSFPRYPKYKPSGVEWLGEVPEHWARKSLKHIANYQNGYPFKPDERGDVGLPILRIAQLTGDERPALFDGELPDRVRVRTGDLLFSWSANIDAFIWQGEGAWLNQHIFKVTPFAGTHRKFLFYVIKHVAPKLADFDAHGSTMRHIKKESLGEPVYAPLLPEQTAIAEFLDRETGKIDELVAEQRRLMELLKEKRQAVISHAVTKGLNPHAPMKPSGIEWLGDVPEHWTVKRFQRCVYVAEGQVDPTDGNFANMSLIAPNHIESGTGRLLGLETSADQGAESGKYFCKTGDVVYSKIRPALRKVCIAPEDCLCSADMYPLRPHSGLTPTFLFWLILSEQFSALAELESQRVAMPKINRESLKAVMLAVPPVEEQNTINAFLDSETAKFDTLTAEAQRAIDLLQERRTALISAAVTGQIDVRPQIHN